LTFLSASDEGCFDQYVYSARLQKEAASLAHWQGVATGLRSLPELQAWLHSDHLCYAVQRQHEFGKRTIKVGLRTTGIAVYAGVGCRGNVAGRNCTCWTHCLFIGRIVCGCSCTHKLREDCIHWQQGVLVPENVGQCIVYTALGVLVLRLTAVARSLSLRCLRAGPEVAGVLLITCVVCSTNYVAQLLPLVVVTSEAHSVDWQYTSCCQPGCCSSGKTG
jgi:hypothetical protein